MATQHDNLLGFLITDSANAKKDAIHVPIMPTTAATRIRPGQGVRFSEDGSCVSTNSLKSCHGIADPFLTKAIEKGEKFYVLMMPGTVTRLRHEWDSDVLPKNEQAYDKRLEETLQLVKDLQSDLRDAERRAENAESDNSCRGCY